jgi:hypothetical protein
MMENRPRQLNKESIMETQEITVKIDNNFGSERIYPADDNARAFARIAGTKTLTRTTIDLVKQLGFGIKVEQPELNV